VWGGFALSEVEMKKEDYGYCEDCEMFFDLWKYGDVESAGHDKCNWRYVTGEELKNCVQGCKDNGCFEEAIE
jgi:hypothetical protein